MISQTVGRYARTIAALKPVQITSRLKRLCRKRKLVSASIASIETKSLQSSLKDFIAPHRLNLNDRQLILLNRVSSISAEAIALQDMLWRYKYYYFDGLLHPDLVQRTQFDGLFKAWVDNVAVFTGESWDAYPVSLRIFNLIKRSLVDQTFSSQYSRLLYRHGRLLVQNLETHILGNHYLENAMALCAVGLYFEGVEPKKWFDKGLQILKSEIKEQVLADGAHFELSPMYHSVILERLLDLSNIGQVFGHDFGLKEIIQKMFFWLEAMSHPDGQISFFNDANFTMGPTRKDLRAYAEKLDIKWQKSTFGLLTHLEASGYIRCQSDNALCLIDVAKVGPIYQPGHAHADTLSFELSLYGQRHIVNSGTSTYWQQPLRHQQRSTKMHNTVEVDGQNSSEVWGQFRVGARAKILFCDIEESKEGVRIQAAHNGYKRLGVNHARAFYFQPKRQQIVLIDQLQGKAKPWVSRLHLHPDVVSQSVLKIAHTADEYSLEDAMYYSEMNQHFDNKVHVFKMKPGSQRLETVLSWSGTPHDS